MKSGLHERDITEAVCRRCAACCRVKVTVNATNSRFRAFLRTVGVSFTPEAPVGATDCCAEVHDIEVDLGECTHLETTILQGKPFYTCRLHGTDRLPQLCSEYNCVSWAKAHNVYQSGSSMMKRAEAAAKVVAEIDGLGRDIFAASGGDFREED